MLPSGTETFVEVQVEDALLTVRLERTVHMEARSRVRIGFNPSEAHVFAQSTGNRLG